MKKGLVWLVGVIVLIFVGVSIKNIPEKAASKSNSIDYVIETEPDILYVTNKDIIINKDGVKEYFVTFSTSIKRVSYMYSLGVNDYSTSKKLKLDKHEYDELEIYDKFDASVIKIKATNISISGVYAYVDVDFYYNKYIQDDVVIDEIKNKIKDDCIKELIDIYQSIAVSLFILGCCGVFVAVVVIKLNKQE